MARKNKLTLLLILICLKLPTALFAQVDGDSIHCVEIVRQVLILKTADCNERHLEFKGAQLRELLSNQMFSYSGEHPISTRSGFLTGWHFKLNEKWKIDVYFDKKTLTESDNIYLNNIELNTIANRKIKRIVVVKTDRN